MAIYDNGSRESYTIQAGETSFSFPYRIFTYEDMVVYWVPAADEDNPVTLVYPTDYTLTGIDDNNGGTVELVSVLPQTGDVLILQRDVQVEKLPAFDYANSQGFDPDIMDENFDKQYAILQQVNDSLSDRFLSYPVTADVDSTQTTVPVLDSGYFWMAGTGGGIEAVTLEENPDWSTLRSELASNTSGADGALMIGYYDSEDTPNATTVHAKLDALHGFTPPISSDISIVKDSVDNTKLLSFDVSGITTATTRTITMPDENVSLAESTTTAKGLAEIATQAEVDAGTDTTKFVTPATLASSTHIEGGMMIAFSQTDRLGTQTGKFNLTVSLSASIYTYSFDSIRSDTNFVVVVNIFIDTGAAGTHPGTYDIYDITTSGFKVRTYNSSFVAADLKHSVRVFAERT